MAVLVGKKAPDFTASAVINGEEIVENFTLSDYAGKYVVLLFYPKDFTFVCPTELHAFQARKEEFSSKGVELIAVSTDTEQSHWGWLQMNKDQGGIQGVTYPIVADTNKTISHNYDVLNGEWSYDDDGNLQATGEMIAYRGLFLIDKEGTVMHQNFLISEGSEIISVENWGLKKLAYSIQNKQSGFYNLIDFKAANTTVELFETELKRDERIMRYLNVKLDKYADAWSVKRRERNTKKA